MSQIGMPINGITYKAEEAGLWFFGRTNGVFALEDNLKVAPDDGMNINVLDGGAWLSPNRFRGIVFANTETVQLTLSPAHATLHRIDRIVIRWNIQQNGMHPFLMIKQGTPSQVPNAPGIERNEIVWEIALADIRVNAGTAILTSAMITDQRANRAIAGFVSDGVMSLLDTELTDHKQTTAFGEIGIHGLRIFDGVFQAWDGYEWIDIATGGGEQPERLPSGNANLIIRTEIKEREPTLSLEGITYVIIHNASGKAVTRRTNIIGAINLSNIAPGSYTLKIHDTFDEYFMPESQTVTLPDAGTMELSFAIIGPGLPMDEIVFDTSGVFTVPPGVRHIDAFIVGGGAAAQNVPDNYGGGGGGYAHFWRDISVTPGESVQVVIGGAGTANNNGGMSFFKNASIFARGGFAPIIYPEAFPQTGGFGGSGGGAGANSTFPIAGNGGFDGNDGNDSFSSIAGNKGGLGQSRGTLWRKPRNPYKDIERYSGGGGGGAPSAAGYTTGIAGIGAKGRGGNRGIGTASTAAESGIIILYPILSTRTKSFDDLNRHITGWLFTQNGEFTITDPDIIAIDIFAIGGGGGGGGCWASGQSTSGQNGQPSIVRINDNIIATAEGGQGGYTPSGTGAGTSAASAGKNAIGQIGGDGGIGTSGSGGGKGGNGGSGGGGGAGGYYSSNKFSGGGGGSGYGGIVRGTGGTLESGGLSGGHGGIFGSVENILFNPFIGYVAPAAILAEDGKNGVRGPVSGTTYYGGNGGKGGSGYGAGGGGGGGWNVQENANAGGGGGSGFFVSLMNVDVNLNDIINIVIGNKGLGGIGVGTNGHNVVGDSGNGGNGVSGCVHVFPRYREDYKLV